MVIVTRCCWIGAHWLPHGSRNGRNQCLESDCSPRSPSTWHPQLPEDGYVSVELVHDPGRGPVSPGGFNHLVIQTEDLHATIAHLAAHGLQADPPSSPNGSEDFWTTWLTDPDGYRIELVRWPIGHADGLTRADFPEAPPSFAAERDPPAGQRKSDTFSPEVERAS